MKKAAKICFFLLLSYLSWIYLFKKPFPWTLLDNINLGVHEFGHLLANVISKNDVFIAFGGTLLQILFPFLFLIYFIRAKDRYGIVFSLFWVGQNLINISYYIADATCVCIPLLGGKNSNHDWNFILSHYNIINKYGVISRIVGFFGKGFIVVSLVIGLKIVIDSFKVVKTEIIE